MPFEPDRIAEASAFLAKQMYLAKTEEQLDLILWELNRLKQLDESYRKLQRGVLEGRTGASHLCSSPRK